MSDPTRLGAYIGFHRELHASDGRYWRYGLDIACIGPCAQGRQPQTWVHRNITNSPAPQGLRAQIRNELGAVARFEYAERLFHEPLAAFGSSVFGLPLATDLRPHVSAGLGNLQIYAGVGVTARIGWFRTSYDSLRLDTHTLESLAGARRDRHAEAGSDSRADCAPYCEERRAPEKAPELFAFARLHGDLVAYNAMLQGGLINRLKPEHGKRAPGDRRARVRLGRSDRRIQRVGVGGWPPAVGYPGRALRTALRSPGARVQYAVLGKR